MPADPQNQDLFERAIDRAVAGVKELMGAELRAIAAELRQINRRLERVDHVETRVEGIDSRMTALEAFKSAHEHRLHELEADSTDHDRWWRDKLPGFALSAIGIALGGVALAAQHL